MIWLIVLILVLVYIGMLNNIENFARYRSYGWPFYHRLKFELNNEDLHYNHFDYKCKGLAKNVMLLDRCCNC